MPQRGRTIQPRATPWERSGNPSFSLAPSPERTEHLEFLKRGRNRDHDCFALTGRHGTIWSHPSPGRCPGLTCRRPFRAWRQKQRNIKTRKQGDCFSGRAQAARAPTHPTKSTQSFPEWLDSGLNNSEIFMISDLDFWIFFGFRISDFPEGVISPKGLDFPEGAGMARPLPISRPCAASRHPDSPNVRSHRPMCCDQPHPAGPPRSGASDPPKKRHFSPLSATFLPIFPVFFRARF